MQRFTYIASVATRMCVYFYKYVCARVSVGVYVITNMPYMCENSYIYIYVCVYTYEFKFMYLSVTEKLLCKCVNLNVAEAAAAIKTIYTHTYISKNGLNISSHILSTHTYIYSHARFCKQTQMKRLLRLILCNGIRHGVYVI